MGYDPNKDSSAFMTDDGSVMHNTLTPSRIHELYSLHEKKQKRLETQRNKEAEEELKCIEESKEAMKRFKGRQWHPSELNPVDASERLFKDGRTADLRRREMQRKKLEDELQKIEEERIR